MQAAIALAETLGPLRIAVSCAGIGWAQRTVNKEGAPHDLTVFNIVLGVNLVGTFNVLRLAAAHIPPHRRVVAGLHLLACGLLLCRTGVSRKRRKRQCREQRTGCGDQPLLQDCLHGSSFVVQLPLMRTYSF